MICNYCQQETEQASFCTHCGSRRDLGFGPGRSDQASTSPDADHGAPDSEELDLISFVIQELETSGGMPGLAQRGRMLAEAQRWQAQLLLESARALADQERWDEALETCRRVPQAEPGRTEANFTVAQIYQRLSQSDDAVRAYLSVINVRPTWAQPYLRLAEVYQQQGRFAEALREVRQAANLERDGNRLQEVIDFATELEQMVPSEVQPEQTTVSPRMPDTPARLWRLLESVEYFAANGLLGRADADRLQRHYEGRLSALGASPQNTRVARSAGFGRPGPTPVREWPDAGTTSQSPPGTVSPQRQPAAATSSGASRAPAGQPMDIGSFLSALLSERNLHGMLYVGALLLLVSSVAVTAVSWSQNDPISEWLGRQAFLTVAGLMFFWVGHLVRERWDAFRAGGVLLSVGALWVPLAVGHIVYRFIEPQGATVIPAMDLSLDLPVLGWFIITASGVPVYALLAYRFHLTPMVVASGIALAASLGLALATTGMSASWRFAGISALGPAYLAAAIWAKPKGLLAMASGLFGLAHVGVPIIFFALLAIDAELTAPVVFTAWSAVALYVISRLAIAHAVFEVLVAVSFASGLFLTLALTAPSFQLSWYGLILAGMGGAYAAVGQWVFKAEPWTFVRGGPNQNPTIGVSPFHGTGLALTVAALAWAPMWEDGAWISRIATLYTLVAVYAISSYLFRPKAWALTYLAAGLLPAAFMLTLRAGSLGSELPEQWHGLMLMPFPVAFWLLAQSLQAFPKIAWPKLGRHSVPGRLGLNSPAAPLYLVSLGLAGAVPALSTDEPWLLTGALAAASLMYAYVAWASGRAIALYPALLATHLGGVQAIYLAVDGSWPLTGVYFGAVVLGVWLAAESVSSRISWPSWWEQTKANPAAAGANWSIPLWAFAALGAAFSLGATLGETRLGLAMALSCGFLIVASGTRWRQEMMVLVGIGVLLGFAFPQALVLASVALVHAPVYAAGFGLGLTVVYYELVRRQRADSTTETSGAQLLAAWVLPLAVGSAVMSGAALVFSVGLAYNETAVNETSLHEGNTAAKWLALVLVMSGANLVWRAFQERNWRLSYAGVALAIGALMVLLGVLGVSQPLFYLVPGGVYLMAVAYLEWRWGTQEAFKLLEAGGLLLLLGATLGLSIAEAVNFNDGEGHYYEALWLFFSSLGVMLFGALAHWKRTFLAAIGVFVVNLFVLLSMPAQIEGLGFSWWWIVLIMAVVLIAGGVVLERRREQVVSVSREIIGRLEQWH